MSWKQPQNHSETFSPAREVKTPHPLLWGIKKKQRSKGNLSTYLPTDSRCGRRWQYGNCENSTEKASASCYTFWFGFFLNIGKKIMKENGLLGCRKNRFPKLHLQAAKKWVKKKAGFPIWNSQSRITLRSSFVGLEVEVWVMSCWQKIQEGQMDHTSPWRERVGWNGEGGWGEVYLLFCSKRNTIWNLGNRISTKIF